MKCKMLTKLVILAVLGIFLIPSCFAATVLETPEQYGSDGVYIFGSTRFDGNTVLDADVVYNAGINETIVWAALGNNLNDLVRPTPYYYNGATWYKLTSAAATPVTDETAIQKIEDNLYIFFVGEEEKKVEVPFDGTVDEGSVTERVTYDNENKKFVVPALSFDFKFTSDGAEIKVETNVDTNTKAESSEEVVATEIIPEKTVVKIGNEYFTADKVADAIAKSSLEKPAELYKNDFELTGTLTIKKGNALVIPEGRTFVAKAGSKIVVEKGANFVVNGKFEFIDGATIDGNVTLKGGRWVTNMYPMAGPDNSKYIATDAVFTMYPTNYDMVIASGEVSLGEDHRTLPGQTIKIANGAKFTIPTEKTLQVYSKVVIEEGGTVLINGNLDLQTGATLDGNITVKGGNVISEGTRITGKDNCAYGTEDAVYRMYENGDITVVSGDIVLTEAFGTMEGQKLVLCKGASFTIPEKIGFYVKSDLTVEEGATFTVKGKLILEETSKFTVKGTLEFIDGATIDGDVALKGGRWITNMYDMAGPEGCKYKATDAVFTMKPTNYDMVVKSGEVSLGEDHRTFLGQNIVVGKEAKFTVPAGMKLQVYSTVTIEEGAEVIVAGTLSLEQGGSITGKYTVTETGLVARPTDVALLNNVGYATIADALAAANDGDTINLLAGNHSKVLIDYRKNVAKNITLVGTEGVNIAGVNMNGGNFGFVPEGLTFKNITFTGDVNVNNTDKFGVICKNLSIIGCTFTNAAFLVGSNSTIDGLKIENNKFNGTNTTNKTSILLQGENHTNVLIKGNTIDGSVHNAVQLAISFSGKATIEGNTIKNTGSRAIRISTGDGAELTISNNIISNVNTNPEEAEENNGQVMKITGDVISSTAEGNTYNGKAISFVDGIAAPTVEE